MEITIYIHIYIYVEDLNLVPEKIPQEGRLSETTLRASRSSFSEHPSVCLSSLILRHVMLAHTCSYHGMHASSQQPTSKGMRGVSATELEISYYSTETVLFILYPYYGRFIFMVFNSNPEGPR